MKRKRLALLISGRGSNMAAILAAAGPDYPAEPVLVLSNRADAAGLEVAAARGLTLANAAPFAPGQKLGEALLAPTRIYVKPLLALHRAGLLHAAAHITGGGLPGNLPRVLPAGVTAVLQAGSWPVPPVFAFLAEAGNVSADEMLRVFNCGLGMVLAVPAEGAEAATRILTEAGEAPFRIGHLEASSGPAGIRIENLPASWPRA